MAPLVAAQDAEGGESAGGSGGGSGQGVYEAVRDFCLVRPAVAYVDLMATFYDLSEDQLGKVLDGLQREGLIQVGWQGVGAGRELTGLVHRE